jgi:hypothetical protein
MSSPSNPPKREDYGTTGKTKEKQVPGADGMQHPKSHGPNEPDPDPSPDDDDPRKTDRERQPEEA